MLFTISELEALGFVTFDDNFEIEMRYGVIKDNLYLEFLEPDGWFLNGKIQVVLHDKQNLKELLNIIEQANN